MTKLPKDIWIYLILTLGSTTLFSLSDSPVLLTLIQLFPMIFAIIALFIGRIPNKLSYLGLSKIGHAKYYLYTLFFAGMVLVAFLIAWSFSIVDLPPADNFPNGKEDQWGRFQLLLSSFFSIAYLLSPLLFSFGEELGWRGYLQPRLIEKLGETKAIFATAGIWAFYHYPMFFFANYTEQSNLAVQIPLFTLMIVPLSLLMGWIRIRSQSIWPIVLFHAAVNHFRFFGETLFYVKKDYWTFFAGESGIITILLWTILAFVVWKRNKTKTKASHS